MTPIDFKVKVIEELLPRSCTLEVLTESVWVTCAKDNYTFYFEYYPAEEDMLFSQWKDMSCVENFHGTMQEGFNRIKEILCPAQTTSNYTIQ